MKFTSDEMMVVCMARNIQDGEVVVQGIATPLVAAAYLLARKTHAPNLYFASAIGQSLCKEPAPLGISQIESLWLDRSLSNIGFARTATEFLPALKPKEFFRPAQVDPYGNFNNIAFGRVYTRPKLRLPGTGGIPDVTTYFHKTYLYVPRHSKVTFVPKLDFISGLGYHPNRKRGQGPKYLISNLGLFDFYQGRMRLISCHFGYDTQTIFKKTGFDFELAPEICETKPPTRYELQLLREEIDPLGIRRLEQLSGSSRRKLLREILIKEKALK
jgi:acyl CoA:acetate/3-ketoacid CoA transferase beta subunit